jgi:hypothetical protein
MRSSGGGVPLPTGNHPESYSRLVSCQLPGCLNRFLPGRTQTKNPRFCCGGHRVKYWKLAQSIGDKVLRGDYSGLAMVVSSGKTQESQIRNVLVEAAGEWVSIRKKLPFVLWNSRRISDLRKKGFVIECRKMKSEYQYRLVK